MVTREDPTSEPVRVVYIMGTGRSGSTLVGITLGNIPGWFFGGELFAWNHFKGVPITDDEALASYWATLGARVPDEARYFDHDFRSELEHPRSLLRPWRRRSSRGLHHHHNAALFAAIAEHTDARIVCDSSHYPLRALLLADHSDIDLRVLHLVRDPRDVVNALQNPEQRHTPMHPLAASAYCWAVAGLSSLAMRLCGRPHLLVRYEDFTADPQRVVDQVCALADEPESTIDPSDLEVGPVFQGNRLRHGDTIAIRRPQTVRRLSPAWSMITDILLSPLRLAYGYLGRRAPGRSTVQRSSAASV